MNRRVFGLAVLCALASGCATVPAGPHVAVMPAPGKPFDLFVADDTVCRQFAEQQTGTSPQGAMTQSVVGGSAAGAALGAAAGTAIGSLSGQPGAGAIVGAGTGLMAGSATGVAAGSGSSWEVQRRYDVAYQQCMYAKGNQIPGMPAVAAPPPLPPPPAARPPV